MSWDADSTSIELGNKANAVTGPGRRGRDATGVVTGPGNAASPAGGGRRSPGPPLGRGRLARHGGGGRKGKPGPANTSRRPPPRNSHKDSPPPCSPMTTIAFPGIKPQHVGSWDGSKKLRDISSRSLLSTTIPSGPQPIKRATSPVSSIGTWAWPRAQPSSACRCSWPDLSRSTRRVLSASSATASSPAGISKRRRDSKPWVKCITRNSAWGPGISGEPASSALNSGVPRD
uniref:Uncharacterized protein n=1 Tax=Sarcophilus harrisii TaxID=9305 RepID=A0A7N4PIT1_SARHA